VLVDGLGLAEAMLGLDGFRVLEVSAAPDELVVTIETMLMLSAARAAGGGRLRRIGYRSRSRSCVLRSA
jgi:hypothetical protein